MGGKGVGALRYRCDRSGQSHIGLSSSEAVVVGLDEHLRYFPAFVFHIHRQVLREPLHPPSGRSSAGRLRRMRRGHRWHSSG